ncbi:MAG: hypothetical protein ACYDH6_13915 [Acidimicrobiales bacterium]
MDDPEQGEQAVPSGVRTFERLVTRLSLDLAELLKEGGCGERAVVELVAERQQVALFRVQQQHEAHQHSDRRLVDAMRVDAYEKRALALAIGSADCGDKEFDRPADLLTELAGDLGLGRGGLGEQRLEAIWLGDGEETPCAQHGREGIEKERFLGEQIGTEGGCAAGACLRCPNQLPRDAVGGDADLDPGGSAQQGQPFDG